MIDVGGVCEFWPELEIKSLQSFTSLFSLLDGIWWFEGDF
jgi:hypothetical protein